jgi:hypothetical protein
MTFFAL